MLKLIVALSGNLDNTLIVVVRNPGHFERVSELDYIEEHIKRYVNEHNTTVAAVANAIGISRSSIYDKMGGKRPWLLYEAADLAKFLGCRIDDLYKQPEAVA